MARKRMVTRTVEQTTAQVMTLDVTTAEVQVITYDIGGQYTDEELLKKLQRIFQTDTLKLVHIESQTCNEVLLGMDEEEFIRLAKVLPPRNSNNDEYQAQAQYLKKAFRIYTGQSKLTRVRDRHGYSFNNVHSLGQYLAVVP